MVMMAAGWQIPRDQIAMLIIHPKTGLAISETSMEKYFRKELLKAAAHIRVLHARALFKQVTDGNVTAAIWWDKTRNRIGQNFHAKDHGEDKPTTPPIEAETTDIVVIARRVAFTLAMGKAKMARAETTAIKPVKATSTAK